MRLTPRQIAAFLDFSNVEQAQQLALRAIAAQGDDKSRAKAFKELNGRTLQNHD